MTVSDSHSWGEARTEGRQAVVLCLVDSIACAVPLEHVSETLRPLPIDALSGAAHFIEGISIIRGKPTPVVDLARLLGKTTSEPRTRLLVLKIGERRAALLVGRVLGVRSLDTASVMELPPLLSGASSEAVAAVGSLDARLLLVLETSRVLPDSTWAILEGAKA